MMKAESLRHHYSQIPGQRISCCGDPPADDPLRHEQRNLIYTGITRAKKNCIIVGTTKALAYSVHDMVVLKRNTKLKERLKT